MLQTELSADSLRIMMDNREEEHDGEFLTCNPHLQILSIHEIARREGLRHRYRVVLSDSRYMANGVLSADLDHLVDDGIALYFLIVGTWRMGSSQRIWIIWLMMVYLKKTVLLK